MSNTSEERIETEDYSYEDLQLVEGLIAGDSTALRSLYERYSGLFFVIAKRYVGGGQEAEDLVQESFIHIYKKASTFSHKGSFEGWMKRVVVNLCLTAIKRKRLKYDDSMADLEDTDIISATDWTIERMNANEIIKAFDELPDGCRAVLNLSIIDGYSHKEIADQLNITESASRSQLTKARARLRAILQEKHLIDS